jgi:hypothetical protein
LDLQQTRHEQELREKNKDGNERVAAMRVQNELEEEILQLKHAQSEIAQKMKEL